MKVVVLGGYGVFGSRLSRLLVRDGQEVLVAGRSREKAEAFAQDIGATPLVVDRTAPDAMFTLHPDVIVDAAGPFQTYGDDPYHLVRACITAGVSYVDLADDAAFVGGIETLSPQAEAAGCRVISGASTVPGLSSAVATELVKGMDEVLLIDSAILPGNRAPRGTSVIASILGQLGTARPVWRGGRWVSQRVWSQRAKIALAPDLVRTGRFIEVPDITLFPDHFTARSVMFRAGMEVPLLDVGMAAFAILRRILRFPVTDAVARVVRWAASLTEPFGSDRGGMRVLVAGRIADQVIRREWRLVAEAGEGPFIPAVTARALIRCLDRIAPGASPCIGIVTLAEIEAAMSDLAVTWDRNDAPHTFLFQAAIGSAWTDLPDAVRRLHQSVDRVEHVGRAEVTHGSHPVLRSIAALFGFPPAANDTPVKVTITATDEGEMWERNFGGRVFRSHLTSAGPGRVYERFGPFRFQLGLPVRDGVLAMPVEKGWFLGVPLPRMLLPGSETQEHADDGCFQFDVAVTAPFGLGLIVRYRGWLKPT